MDCNTPFQKRVGKNQVEHKVPLGNKSVALIPYSQHRYTTEHPFHIWYSSGTPTPWEKKLMVIGGKGSGYEWMSSVPQVN